jgi:hypothetical protein
VTCIDLDPSDDRDVLDDAPIEKGKDALLDLTTGAAAIGSDPPDPSDPLKLPALILKKNCTQITQKRKTIILNFTSKYHFCHISSLC